MSLSLSVFDWWRVFLQLLLSSGTGCRANGKALRSMSSRQRAANIFYKSSETVFPPYFLFTPGSPFLQAEKPEPVHFPWVFPMTLFIIKMSFPLDGFYSIWHPSLPTTAAISDCISLGESCPHNICFSITLVIEQQSVTHSKGDKKSSKWHVISF